MTWFEKLFHAANDSVNLLAFGLVLVALAFHHSGATDVANQLVVGAIGLMGGKAMASSSRRSSDFPEPPKIPSETNGDTPKTASTEVK